MLARISFDNNPAALFQHVAACWEEIRGANAFPARTDIRPSKLASALPYVSLIELIPGDPPDFLYRLMGQHLIVNAGQNITGMRSSQLPAATPNGRPIYQSYVDCIRSGQVQQRMSSIINLNGTARTIHWCVWPLAADGRTPDGLLGSALYTDA